jgi:hypothetical protein
LVHLLEASMGRGQRRPQQADKQVAEALALDEP